MERFLILPNENHVRECYRDFCDRMSKQSIETRVCAICAREQPVLAENLTTTTLAVLLNIHRLVPHTPHNVHNLYFRCVLQLEGVQQGLTREQTLVTTCQTCRANLQNLSRDLPRLSLANSMWVGCVLWQSSSLTLPEHMLIALLYPPVYVFKLYPKTMHYQPDPSSLQRAMRGTMSMYEMKPTAVADMVDGSESPRRFEQHSAWHRQYLATRPSACRQETTP
jgi:hypothetical protein